MLLPRQLGQLLLILVSAPAIGRVSQFGTQLAEGATSGSVGGFFDSVYAAADPTGQLINAADVASPNAATQTIKSGDTLSQIAADNGTTVDALLDANPNILAANAEGNTIIAGESINIPQVSAGGTTLSESVVKNVGEALIFLLDHQISLYLLILNPL